MAVSCPVSPHCHGLCLSSSLCGTNASAPALPRNDDSAQESIIFHFPTCAPSFPVFPSFCLPASQSLPNLTLSGPICAAGGWLFPLHYPPFGLFSLRRRPRPPLSLPLCFAFAFAFSPASAKFASASQHFTVPFLSSSMCPCVHQSMPLCTKLMDCSCLTLLLLLLLLHWHDCMGQPNSLSSQG